MHAHAGRGIGPAGGLADRIEAKAAEQLDSSAERRIALDSTVVVDASGACAGQHGETGIRAERQRDAAAEVHGVHAAGEALLASLEPRARPLLRLHRVGTRAEREQRDDE